MCRLNLMRVMEFIGTYSDLYAPIKELQRDLDAMFSVKEELMFVEQYHSRFWEQHSKITEATEKFVAGIEDIPKEIRTVAAYTCYYCDDITKLHKSLSEAIRDVDGERRMRKKVYEFRENSLSKICDVICSLEHSAMAYYDARHSITRSHNEIKDCMIALRIAMDAVCSA